jgi:proteasome lid subunit RPN8/RPN11
MILLPDTLARQLTEHLTEAYPDEGCGLLIGCKTADGIRITDIAISNNLAAEPAHRFEIDTALHLRLQRQLREANDGSAVIGLYHSHPNGLAEPSDTDRAMAWEPDFIWLIAAVENGHVRPPNAFRMIDRSTGFEPVELCIAPDTPGDDE